MSVQRPESCSSCSLYGAGRGFVLSVGDPSAARIAIILETPASEEVGFSVLPPSATLGTRQVLGTVKEAQAELLRRTKAYPNVPAFLRARGVPVVGRTGALLNRLLRQAGIDRDSIFIDNSIRCVKANTAVWMADGTWKQIRYIKPGEFVKAQIKGRIVDSEVLEVTRTPNRGQWLQVDVDGGHRRNQGKNCGVTVTVDHEWVTPKGRVRTDALNTGAEIYLPQPGSFDVLYGSLQGDGHIREDGHFSVTHTNEGWINAKAALFGLTPRLMKRGKSSFPNGAAAWGFTVGVPREWREKFYTSDGLRKWNSPSDKQLAIIYGDDGCASRSGKYWGANIARQSFVPLNTEIIIEFFRKEFGSGSMDKAGNIRLGNGAAARMFERIAPWLHPSVQYKMAPEYRGRYNGWMEKEVSIPLIGKVLSVHAPKIKENNRAEMCLVVKDAHNFFTRCGLVSNCFPPKSKKGDTYPTGADKSIAQSVCRQYDQIGGGPEKFLPDVVVISMHPAALFKDGASSAEPLILADLEKAASFAKDGLRVLVVMGGHAAEVVLGFGQNVSKFRGHYEWIDQNWLTKRLDKLKLKSDKARRSGMPREKKKTKAELGREELATKVLDALQVAGVPIAAADWSQLHRIVTTALTPTKRVKTVTIQPTNEETIKTVGIL